MKKSQPRCLDTGDTRRAVPERWSWSTPASFFGGDESPQIAVWNWWIAGKKCLPPSLKSKEMARLREAARNGNACLSGSDALEPFLGPWIFGCKSKPGSVWLPQEDQNHSYHLPGCKRCATWHQQNPSPPILPFAQPNPQSALQHEEAQHKLARRRRVWSVSAGSAAFLSPVRADPSKAADPQAERMTWTAGSRTTERPGGRRPERPG